MARIMLDDGIFQVPEEYLTGLEKLATLDDEVIENILQSLETAPLTFDIQEIALFAKNQHGIDATETSEVLSFIASLYSFGRNEYISFDVIVDALGKSLENETPIKLSTVEISKIRSRLMIFLNTSSSLKITYEASTLFPEHENILSDSRLLTDIRPIFKEEISTGVSGLLISHVLRLKYENISGSQEIFLSLRSSDIEQLIEELQESLTKELTLKQTFEKNNIPCLMR
jgi:hypothetical protein